MTRIARVVVPGFPYHVTHRGNRRASVFFSDEDREVYLALLHEHAQKEGLDIWAWCLMTNHVHLIVIPKHENSMARAIGRATCGMPGGLTATTIGVEDKGMKSFRLRLLKRWGDPIIAQRIEESVQMHSAYYVHGIEFVGPHHYLPTLEMTFDALRTASPEAYALVKKYTTTVYAHPKPEAWYGLNNKCAFITSEMKPQVPYVWDELVGYLTKNSKINDFLSQNRASALHRWTATNKVATDLKRETLLALEKLQDLADKDAD